MNRRSFTLEHFFYILAFIIALGIRTHDLGMLPLSEHEANLALQALDVARGSQPLITSQPGYILWTGGLFFIMGSGDAVARLLPAVIGSLLILVPYVLRHQLGRKAAVILAFAFALDPGLIALSRMADGQVIALVFALLAACFLLAKKSGWGGVFAGLAFLGGPMLWQGLLGLSLAAVWSRLSVRRMQDICPDGSRREYQWSLKQALVFFAGTLFFMGTLFFRVPTGLNAAAANIVNYIRGWNQVPAVYIQQVLMAFPAYEILPLALGAWGGIRGWIVQDEIDVFFSRWFLIAVLLILIYPSRQVLDLCWALIPLWVLAARQLNRETFSLSSDWVQISVHALLVFILLGFILFNLVNMAGKEPGTYDVRLPWVGIGGAVLLIVFASIGVAWGWSLGLSRRGLVWGIGTFLVIFTLSAAWNAAGLGRRPSAELWRADSLFSGQDLLLETIGDVSEWNTGIRDNLDVSVVGLESSALRWSLRGFLSSKFVEYLPELSEPSAIITDQNEMVALAEEYSGQDLVVEQETKWEQLLSVDWINWMFLRNIQSAKRYLILWVRSDLFPGVESFHQDNEE